MSSNDKTSNLELNQWNGNEYPKRTDFIEDNKKIDEAYKELKDIVKNGGKVSSVNGKIGDVILKAEDIKTEQGTTIESQLTETVNKDELKKELEKIDLSADKIKLNNSNFISKDVNGALNEVKKYFADKSDKDHTHNNYIMKDALHDKIKILNSKKKIDLYLDKINGTSNLENGFDGKSFNSINKCIEFIEKYVTNPNLQITILLADRNNAAKADFTSEGKIKIEGIKNEIMLSGYEIRIRVKGLSVDECDKVYLSHIISEEEVYVSDSTCNIFSLQSINSGSKGISIINRSICTIGDCTISNKFISAISISDYCIVISTYNSGTNNGDGINASGVACILVSRSDKLGTNVIGASALTKIT
ncbi:hypothetical protein [Clostridium sp. Marseille-Q7071]